MNTRIEKSKFAVSLFNCDRKSFWQLLIAPRKFIDAPLLSARTHTNDFYNDMTLELTIKYEVCVIEMFLLQANKKITHFSQFDLRLVYVFFGGFIGIGNNYSVRLIWLKIHRQLKYVGRKGAELARLIIAEVYNHENSY